MKENNLKITYTITDEAPMLATYSLFPILKSYVSKAGILLEAKNISLSQEYYQPLQIIYRYSTRK
ncbi:MAG: hypothetical protein CM15mP112_03810 [Flavobacteriales bacterium]|nr:MAG: hypothetical protein CM15mP112_03810 [Flavobacteriales bacterium]